MPGHGYWVCVHCDIEGMTLRQGHDQGGHGLWKTGKKMKKIPCVEKSGNLIKIRKSEKSGNFTIAIKKVDYWWFIFFKS